jgi:hypothetical protein
VWRRGSLYRGDGGKFLVHGEKRGGDREAAGDGFIPYMTTFLLLGWDRRAAEVALMGSKHALSLLLPQIGSCATIHGG